MKHCVVWPNRRTARLLSVMAIVAVLAASGSFAQMSASAKAKAPLGKLVASPKSINFGTVKAPAKGSFNLRNAGSASVNGSVNPPGPPFFVTSGAGRFSLIPGASISITVQFAPTQKGKFKGAVAISSDAKRGGHLNLMLRGS